jgi:D-sedoheptulose 7-phosphate isomerase
VIDSIQSLEKDMVDRAVNLVTTTLISGKTVFTCGNGGSSATASHFVNDWTKGLNGLIQNNFKAHCLCDNFPTVSAIANDLSYESIFSEQINMLASPGDLLVAVSGSGNSRNIVKALEFAKKRDVKTVGVLGFDGGVAKSLVDEIFWVNSNDMQVVEDIHGMFGHLVFKNAWMNYAK